MAAALIAAPATAHAAAVPTTDEVVAIEAELTDPNIPAANKGEIVTPAFTPEEAGTIDNHLNRMNAVGLLPLPFAVTDIEPAPNNFARAMVETNGGLRQGRRPRPIVLVDQGGHWLLTHDSATEETDGVWRVANRFL
ncbi:hypothetical protein [Mycobacterium sp.]|uniref:hypothetical protein n=1 Tax=Mycobacterium sp. TaxID=1785 RepID=UPI003D1078F7